MQLFANTLFAGPATPRGVSDNYVNCWNTLRAANTTTQPAKANVKVEKFADWAISSQASLRDEGSTTRATARSAQASTKCVADLNRETGRYSLGHRESGGVTMEAIVAQHNRPVSLHSRLRSPSASSRSRRSTAPCGVTITGWQPESGLPLHSVRIGANSVNCWESLRATGTTTQPAKANVTVQKACGLGNQQPSISNDRDEGSTTRATARSAQASAKCGGTGFASPRYSLDCSETSRVTMEAIVAQHIESRVLRSARAR